MTNKKLKLAAMSVALTACVAAQPMAAHAVEGPDSVEDNAAPQAEPAPVEGKTAEGEVEGEEEKQEEVGEQEEFVPPVNKEAKEEEQAPAFGPGTKTEDIIIDYKPAEKPEEPGKSGEDGETDGSEGSGETDETENPDGTYVKGDVIDNSKKDEATGKDGKIGEATKEETPDSSSSTTVVDPDAEVKKGDPVVGKDEDGNPTITTPTETTGTQTTTTTGTGKADSSTTIPDTKKGEEIDLNKELKNEDGEVEKPTWGTKTDDKLGGYTVDKVEPSEDGNSKELTLKKTSEPETKEIEMSAEDVAKLLDVPEDGVEKKEELDEEGNPKTTYILKKEETSTDENGNTVTRTTYYEITGNSVKTRTETTLKLKVEKGTVDVNNEDLTTEIELPSITAKNTNETKTDVIEISSEKLGEMLQDGYYNNVTGEYVYTETDANGKEYTYKVKKTEDTKPLTNKQLADRLGKGFTGDDNGVYYKGEKLTFDQKEAVRKTLSYTVEVTEVTKTPGQIEGGNAKKEQAENDAKLAAIRDALTKAAVEAGIDTTGTDFEAKLNAINSTDADSITFTYTDNDGNQHTVTFQYDGATVSTAYDKTGETTVGGKDAEDVTNNTVTGTAYVTGGKESWSETKEITGSGSILGNDFTKLPDGVTEYQVDREGGKADGRITKITIGNNVYEFTYTDNASLPESELEKLRAEAEKNGWTFDESKIQNNLTAVSWTKTTTTTTETVEKDVALSGSDIYFGNDFLQKEDDDSYTITVNGEPISGFQQDTTDSSGNTYIKVDEAGNKTTITVGQRAMTPDEVRDALYEKPDYKAVLPMNHSAVRFSNDEKGSFATWKDSNGKDVKLYYNESTAYIKTLTKTESTMTTINQKKKDEVVSAVQTKLTDLKPGETLILTGEQNGQKTKYTITKDATGKFSMTDNIGDVVDNVATITEVTSKVNEIISNYASYDNLTGKDIWDLLDLQQVYGDAKENEFSHGTDSYWPEEKYENVHHKDGNTLVGEGLSPTTEFGSLSLDAEVSYTETIKNADGTETTKNSTGLLLSSGLKFDYGRKEQISDYVELDKYPDKNYKRNENYYYPGSETKENVHKKGDATTAKLQKTATTINGRIWNGSDYEEKSKLTYVFQDNNNTNAFNGKRFYHITGQVACDEVAGTFTKNAAIRKAAELGGTATWVEVKDKNGNSVYKVYERIVDVEAYGYMTASANTNYSANSYENRNGWTPGNASNSAYYGKSQLSGYDLRIQGLVMHGDKMQNNYGAKYSIGMETIHNGETSDTTSGYLKTNDYLHTVTQKEDVTTKPVSDLYGDYKVSYTKNLNDAEGTGTGSSYKTFTEVLKKIFSGSGSKEHDEGKVSYTYRTTDKVDTTPVSKETVTTTDAHVDYNYTSIETRKVTVSGEETVIVPPVTPPVDPDTPDGPVEDETPDEVVTPETPELPPVQDATPNDAAPETPVLPSDAVLPAVQDALPQTGVNWMAALGMAFSGMLLTIAGAFASLKYKEKH